MILRVKFIFVFFIFGLSPVPAQKDFNYTYYGAEEGLNQNTINSILQDETGLMWFSTRYGICKFDGESFKAYQIEDNGENIGLSNRITNISFDKLGNIWVLPYDKEPQRFDKKEEQFESLRLKVGKNAPPLNIKRISPSKSGRTWMITNNKGVICVKDSSFQVKEYTIEKGNIAGNKIYSIFTDSELNDWLLSDNGIHKVDSNDNLSSFFYSKGYSENLKGQHFYSALQFRNFLFFTSNNGRMWIYDLNTRSFELIKFPTKSYLNTITKVSNNLLAITSFDDGFFLFDVEKKAIASHEKQNTLIYNQLHSCYADRSGNLWFETDKLGILKYNFLTQTYKQFELKVEQMKSEMVRPTFLIFEDKFNRLWIQPKGGGLGYYDHVQDKLIPFLYNEYSLRTGYAVKLHAAFTDKQGILWLSPRSTGLEKIVFNNGYFQLKTLSNNLHSSVENDVKAIMQDKEGNVWISTKGDKIYVTDENGKEKGYLMRNGSIGVNESPIEGATYCMLEDSKSNIWIGTKGNGVYKLTPQIKGKKYDISHFKNSVDDLYSISDNQIYSIHEDPKGNIWFGTYGGGLNLIDSSQTGRFYNSKNLLEGYPIEFGHQIRVINSDKKGNVFVGTTLGLIVFNQDFEKPNKIRCKHFTKNALFSTQSISANDIYDILTTKKGETLLATFGGGINKISNYDKEGFPSAFEHINYKNGAFSDIVLKMVEDQNQNIWVATENNLLKFDPVKVNFETYNEADKQLEKNIFTEGASCLLNSGEVYFGTSHGIFHFMPSEIRSNDYKPYLMFKSLELTNQNIKSPERFPIAENINYLNEVNLKYNQNFINIEFAALDYSDSKKIKYAYLLEGVDNDWVTTIPGEGKASYTNLDPGNYLFKVKSTNSDGVWYDNQRKLLIKISPPYWKTTFAYVLYFIFVFAILFILFRSIFTYYRMKDQVKLEAEKHEMKAHFFTDVSHEIRTPLTMVLSPIEYILNNHKLENETKSLLDGVLKNTHKILNMLNQILDYRKIQKTELNFEEIEIGNFISMLVNDFQHSAKLKNINLEINNEIGNKTIWADRTGIEKIINNLLINAFKFTPRGKAIKVSIEDRDKGKKVAVTVADEGCGMEKETLNKLFKRFASFSLNKDNPSTGIGLSIVKEIANKHHASITVNSQIDKGTSFSIVFQVDKQDLITKEFKDQDFYHILNLENKNKTIIQKPIIEDDQKDIILIVEDDANLRDFLKKVFSGNYNVLEAENGNQGFLLANQEIPDFIISDVMMPEVNGLDLLQSLKAEERTSHIPVILLSAKVALEDKLAGLRYGADDYVEKPFSATYLLAKIESILNHRKKYYNEQALKTKLFKRKQNMSNEKLIVMNPEDELFIEKITKEIVKNIDNNNFLIDDLIKPLGLSRTLIYKKIKSLTGLSPIEFVRDVRIQHAALLLLTTNLMVKEISYMVGISDTKYFSQSFKNKFGVNPSEYREAKDK